MPSFDIKNYEKDVQDYIRSEWNAAKIPMYKGDKFINWQGKKFLVLEDSPVGNAYVKCSCSDKFGFYKGYRPKIVLVS